jgi:hypothetical protein
MHFPIMPGGKKMTRRLVGLLFTSFHRDSGGR